METVTDPTMKNVMLLILKDVLVALCKKGGSALLKMMLTDAHLSAEMVLWLEMKLVIRG